MSKNIKDMNQAQRILNAAFKCISDRGYANVSLRDIADEAGVVLSQLNYYYKNKEGLFVEVINMLAQLYIIEIEDKLKKSKSQKEGIKSLIEYFQELLSENPELIKLLFDLTSMALWSKSLKSLLNELFNSLARLIEKYIVSEFFDKERFKNSSPRILSRIMLGTIIGTLIQIILSNDKEDMLNSLSSMNILFE